MTTLQAEQSGHQIPITARVITLLQSF